MPSCHGTIQCAKLYTLLSGTADYPNTNPNPNPNPVHAKHLHLHLLLHLHLHVHSPCLALALVTCTLCSQTWPTILAHLVSPLRGSTFVYLTPDSVVLPSDRSAQHHNPRALITNRDATTAPLSDLCAHVRSLMGRWLTECRAERDVNVTKPIDFPYNRAVQQYVKLCRANRMRLAYEAAHGLAHRFVVRARFDLRFLFPFQLTARNAWSQWGSHLQPSFRPGGRCPAPVVVRSVFYRLSVRIPCSAAPPAQPPG